MKKSSTGIFSVFTKTRAYKSMLYLFLSFPLCIFYFVIVVTGISLGIGLLVTVFGIFILFGVLLFIYLQSKFELLLLRIFVKCDIPKINLKNAKEGFWKKIKAVLFDPLLWKSTLYFLIKLPLGIISFVSLVTLTSLSISLTLTPVWILINMTIPSYGYDRYVAPFIEANPILIPVAMAVGVFLVFASLHAFNGLTWLHTKMAKIFLKR